MTEGRTDHTFLRDPHYAALAKHYASHPIAVYTGAGVSWAQDVRYGLRGWTDFLHRILVGHAGPDSPAVAEFDRRAEEEWVDDPWRMADWVAQRCGPKAFQEQIAAVVQREQNFQRRWKQLSGRFLRSAPTLNAASAFCGQLRGVVEGTRSPTYRVGPNPRVRAVITSNYDPFLEAASSTMFIQPLLKPVGAVGSHAGRIDQIPVFHIHGYVPFPEREPEAEERPIQPLVDPVLTSADYASAWQADDVYCPTMGPQIHVLRHYTALFIGFSFRDDWVNGLLRRLNEERETRMQSHRLYHYALMHTDDVAARGDHLRQELGVRTIALNSFDELPLLLGDLYRRGLAHDYGDERIEMPVVEKRTGVRTGQYADLSPDECWDILCACRNRAVPGTRRTREED